MTPSESIKAARKAAGLTQAQLAARLGVTRPVVQRYENGSSWPSSTRIQELSDAMGQPITLHWMPAAKGMIKNYSKNEQEKA